MVTGVKWTATSWVHSMPYNYDDYFKVGRARPILTWGVGQLMWGEHGPSGFPYFVCGAADVGFETTSTSVRTPQSCLRASHHCRLTGAPPNTKPHQRTQTAADAGEHDGEPGACTDLHDQCKHWERMGEVRSEQASMWTLLCAGAGVREAAAETHGVRRRRP